MNYSMVLYVVGWILNFEAAFMLPSCLVACIYQEKSGLAFVAAMVLRLCRDSTDDPEAERAESF